MGRVQRGAQREAGLGWSTDVGRGSSVSWEWDQRGSRAQEGTAQAATLRHEPQELPGPHPTLPSCWMFTNLS